MITGTYYVPDTYIRMVRTLCSRYVRMYLVSAGRNLARLQEEVRLVEFAQSTRVKVRGHGRLQRRRA